MNGILTARVGLAARDVCRPIPQETSAKETLGSLMKELVSSAPARRKNEASSPPGSCSRLLTLSAAAESRGTRIAMAVALLDVTPEHCGGPVQGRRSR